MTGKDSFLPYAGIVAMAFPGYYLGEEKAPAKYSEMLSRVKELDLKVVKIDPIVTDSFAAKDAGRFFAEKKVDFTSVAILSHIINRF